MGTYRARNADRCRNSDSLIHQRLNILPQDLEITITETPKHNWGFRGTPGDEIELNYKVEV